MGKTMHNFSVETLERCVSAYSKCYIHSDAFQKCLEFVKHLNPVMYKQMLWEEANACGGIDYIEESEPFYFDEV